MEYDADVIPPRVFNDGCNGDYFWAGEWWVCIGKGMWVKLAPGQGAYNRIR